MIIQSLRRLRRSVTSGFIAALLLQLLVPAIPLKAAACPCSLWPNTAVPAVASVGDTAAVELGVKFTADTAGSITALRFYKGSQNTGTHVGHLWTANGQQLAAATFVNETASGWQQVSLATPVNVAAGTTYVASYFAPVGGYAADGNYFASTYDAAPLHAPASGNGSYVYGGGFPVNSFNATNYWVDVVFSDTVAQDTTPPTVTTVAPGSGSSTTVTQPSVSATFSEPVDPATVSTGTYALRTSGGTLVASTISYDSASFTATLTPSAALSPGTYTATVKGGLTDPRVKDVAGNALGSDYVWSFTVQAAPQLEQGPGGPILVINNAANKFSRYYAEILRAEGYNEFASADVSAISSTLLNQYDVVILGEVPVTSTQVTALTNWVTAGGNLIAMRPDKKLATLLGLTDQATTLGEGYLLINTATAPGRGIVNQTMQYHGLADRYATKTGTTAIATLYSNATTATSNPAVSIRNVGTSGGQAVAFTYDLAKSVVNTHQGNPAWSGQERDGSLPIRPNDLFFGAKVGDVQPDYVNLDKVAIPQADEQQRLLGNIIQHVNKDRKVLPKFWYFPKGSKAVMVMVADDHATANGTQAAFDRQLTASTAGCNVANWECVRSTSLMYATSPMTNAQAAAYQAQGFDIGSHVSTGCNDWTPASLEASVASDLSAFRSKYTSLPEQHATRTHCIAWSDYVTAPKVELNHNLRLDLNYYYWPGSWVQNRPGFFTGSGVPMRFGDTDGSMIDVYQVPSHLVNESGMSFPSAINTLLDRALGAEGYYGAFGTHYDFSDTFDQQLLASAQARGVPLVSAQQLLDWTDARNASSLTGTAWSGSVLNFNATVAAGAGSMMRAMLPLSSSKGTLTAIAKSGAAVSYTTEVVKGIQYAVFPVTSGAYSATYASDTVKPTVSSTSPAANATGVPATTAVTATFSEPMDHTTLTATTFTVKNSSNVAVAGSVSYDAVNKTAKFTPNTALAAGITYTATITGGTSGTRALDIAGNAMASSKIWTFTVSSGGPACPCSLWSNSFIPATITASDTAAVELGVRFTSDTAGKITGVRFYKGPSNTGTHTVSLWDNAGALLATATVTGETASGWQTMSFAAPVNISAGVPYVASYFAPAGGYSYDSGYFAVARDSAPLHAPSGNNGVFTYGGGMPTTSFNSTNYWVDPIFTP